MNDAINPDEHHGGIYDYTTQLKLRSPETIYPRNEIEELRAQLKTLADRVARLEARSP